jgi:1-acyl-sn-glycerol-3-phosphate acyltransferase
LNLKLLDSELEGQDLTLEERFKLFELYYSSRQDPWGLKTDTVIQTVKYILPIYEKYFKVRLHGLENIPADDPFVAVSNHTGQIPIDGVMICMSFFLEPPKPVFLRSMVERFLVKLPFLGTFAAENGAILGDRRNCEFLLRQGESILVFPEGVRGISKPTKKYYQTQNFSQGFFRLAIKNRSKVLPIAVVGAEEMYPWVVQLPRIAKLLNTPALPLPLTSFFLGPLSLLPLPSPIDIYIGEEFDYPKTLNPQAPSEQLAPYVKDIQRQVQVLIDQGLKNRRKMISPKLKQETIKEFEKNKTELIKWIKGFSGK